MKSPITSVRRLPLAALVFAAFAPAAAAEQALEEVIVTAERTEKSLQETPISVFALNADTMERLNIANVADLGSSVPNLKIMPFGVSATTLRFFIRGMGTVDSQITLDSPVGIYLDGVYIGTSTSYYGATGSDHAFYALTVATGKVKWRYPLGEAMVRSSAAVATDGSVYFVTTGPDEIDGTINDHLVHLDGDGALAFGDDGGKPALGADRGKLGFEQGFVPLDADFQDPAFQFRRVGNGPRWNVAGRPGNGLQHFRGQLGAKIDIKPGYHHRVRAR